MLAKDAKSLFLQPLRGISSVGRALAWHARGQRFDPAILHKNKATHSGFLYIPNLQRFAG